MNTIREACDYLRHISPFRSTVTSPAMARHESGGCLYDIHLTVPAGTDVEPILEKASPFTTLIGRTGNTLIFQTVIPNDFQP